MQDSITTIEVRRLLPDVALHIDKAFLLSRLQPLQLRNRNLNHKGFASSHKDFWFDHRGCSIHWKTSGIGSWPIR